MSVVTDPPSENTLTLVEYDDRTPDGLFLPDERNNARMDVRRIRASLILISRAFADLIDEATIKALINDAVADIIDSAPGALDTLNELAAALGDDPNFAATVTNALALKAPLDAPTFTGAARAVTYAPNTNTTIIATTAFVRQLLSGLSGISGATITAPTLTAGDSSKNVANTEFVKAAVDALNTALTDASNAKFAALTLPPVGSYMFWPQYAKTSPGPNWLEPKGQVVSIAAYPDLPAILPAYPNAFDQQSPGGTGLTGGPPGSALGITIDGNRYVSAQSNFMYAQELGGPQIGSAISMDAKGLANTPNILRPVMRGKEIVYLRSSNSDVRSIDTTSAATMAQGEKVSNISSIIGGLTTSRDGDGLYKLPNGHLLALISVSESYTYKRIMRLLNNQQIGQWSAFDPPHGQGLNNPSTPDLMFSWQTKSGAVFVACRAKSSTGAIQIYRTDGVSWTTVGTFNFQSAVGGTGQDVAVYKDRLWRQDLARRPVNVIEESDDGQLIVVNMIYGYLVSRNGGSSWTYLNQASLLGYGTTYYGAGGNDDSTANVAFRWSKAKGRFYFAAIVDRRSGGNQGAAQAKYAVLWTSVDLVSFTKLGEFDLGFSPTNFQMNTAAIAVNNNTVSLSLQTSSNQRSSFILNPTSGTVQTQPAAAGFTPVAYLEKYAEDFTVFEVVDFNNKYGLLWVPADETPIAVRTGSLITYGFYDFGVTATGTHTGASIYNADAGTFQSAFGPIWNFNPVTERKLPNVTLPGLGNGSTQFPINEILRSISTSPRIFMRVK